MENVAQAPPSRIRSFFIKDILEHKTSSTTENAATTTTNDQRAVVNQENSTVTARSKTFTVRRLLATNEKRTEQDTCISGCCECQPGYQYTTVNTRPYYHPYLYSIYRQQAAWRHSIKGGVAYVDPQTALYSQPKQRKARRPWTRAVFSNLQRKGLEKRFQVQKYLTKSDRHQLASMLGLSDNQVKVWFQNRRMKWRQEEQTTEEPASSTDKKSADSAQTVTTSAAVSTESKETPR